MNVPKLRFKDVDGREFPEWKSFLMSELGEFKNGINKSKEDFGHGVPFINLMDVFGKPYFKNCELSLVNANANEIKNYNLFRGDVLFIRSSVKPEGVGETSVILEDLNSTVYSGFLIRFRDASERINLFYKKYCFSNSNFRNQIFSVSTTSANTNINQDSLNNLSISLPCLPEQTKIADFLTAVDEKISFLTQKSDLLAQYKKGVMQKIFSQELRFKDDDGQEFPEWEEKQLGEICNIKTGKKDVNEGNPNGVYPFFTCAKTHTYSDSFSFDCSAILIAGNGEVGHCQKYHGKFEAYQRTYVLSNFQEEIDYVFCYLNSNFQDVVVNQRQMGAMPYIKLSMLTDFKIPIPSTQEQTKIANFLTAIDDKINQSQAELAAVKQYKQGLLQQMFV